MISYSKFLAVLNERYDHQSARVVLVEAMEKAGLSDKKNFEPKEAAALVKALNEVGDGLEDALSAVDASPKAAPAASDAPKPAAKAKEPTKKPAAAKKKKK